jgi:hypothetical protein
MVSAVVTAASAAAALVPFEMSLGCLPAKCPEELFDRKARPVAGHDGHDLLGHRISLAIVRRNKDVSRINYT